MSDYEDTTLRVGDVVEKISGYQWPGVVVAVFRTLKHKVRIVVECTVPGVSGALHIYSPGQLKKVVNHQDAIDEGFAIQKGMGLDGT